MADENPAIIEAGQFLGDDGVFQENWRDNFSGDDADELKADPTLANVKDVRSLARMLVHSEKKFGRDKVALLNEFSTDEDKAEHYTKLGRPPKAEGYEFDKVKLPDGIPRDEAFEAKMGTVLFDAGASKSVATAALNGYVEYISELAEKQKTEDKIANAEANKQLHSVLGSTYDAKMASANIAIEALARPIDNDFAETLKKELPYDACAAQMMIKMGEMISEDKGLKGAPPETGFTPGDARGKANEVMANPYYMSEQPTGKPRNVALHKQLVDEVTKLLQIANT